MLNIQSGRLYKDGKAYQPAGFAVDYSSLQDYRAIIESMRDSGMNLLRFNLAANARDPWLCLHDGMAQGSLNPAAIVNLDNVIRLCRENDIDYWINWLHVGGAGRTVPMNWTTDPQATEQAWSASPWNAANGGPLGTYKEAFRNPEIWWPYLDYIIETYKYDSHFVHFTVCTEGYNFDHFREQNTQAWFLNFQAEAIARVRSLGFDGIVSTGDGTIQVRGREATNYAPNQSVYINHIHPAFGDQKPRISSVMVPPQGYFNHRVHPMMSHITTGDNLWCGALGMGNYVEHLAEDREEFGALRTDADYYANMEYAFGGNLGLGMNWDHEGFLVKYSAAFRYGQFAKWFRDNTTKDGAYIPLWPSYQNTEKGYVQTLEREDKVLYYNYNGLPVRISVPWGYANITGLYGVVTKPRRRWWQRLFG